MNRKYAGIIVAAAGLGAIGLFGSKLVVGSQPEQPNRRRAVYPARSAEVLQQMQSAETLEDQGQHEAARAVYQAIQNSDPNSPDAVHAIRHIARSFRREDDFGQCLSHLQEAKSLIQSPTFSHQLRESLLQVVRMEIADLTAFSLHDKAQAVLQYDEIAAAGGSDNDIARIAGRNAAVLTAELGRYAEASDRAERLLTSPAFTLPIDDALQIRMSQVSWHAQAGNLEAAKAHCVTIWEQNQDRGDYSVLWAGLHLARWSSMPIECNTRLTVCRSLLTKLDAAQANTQQEDTFTQTQIEDMLKQVLVVIADSKDCGDDQFVSYARQRLGLQ